MILLSLRDIQKSYGGNPVLTGANLVVHQGDRIGLVGSNGAGKSTLMKIINGTEPYDNGSVTMKKGLKIGYLEQRGSVTEGLTVQQELEKVFDPLKEMESNLRKMESAMTEHKDNTETTKRLYAEYQRLTDEFEASNGYRWKSSVLGVLSGLGFTESQCNQRADRLSGGERTRLCLGKLLLTKPEMLLLDEPTNHLDLTAVSWLEKYLCEYKGTIMMISHDRYFLDRVCTHVAELLCGKTEQYKGNYADYSVKRTQLFDARLKAFNLQQKEIIRQETIINRFRMFNREKSIRAAESREKRLSKMERLEKPDTEPTIHFRFDVNRRSGDDVMVVKGLSKGFGHRTLFQSINLHIRTGDRIALIGPNGIGKSTLIKCLAFDLRPDTGTIRLGTNVDIGYYDQHQTYLDNGKTVIDEVWDSFPRLSQNEVRSALGLFLFTGEDVFLPVAALSGGERGRLALTKLMLKKDNMLLLDEPTNHLDMDSCEILEQALSDYPGTIFAISHDRYFINRFAEKVFVLNNGTVSEFLGNYDDYLEKINAAKPVVSEGEYKTRTEAVKEKRRTKLVEEKIRSYKVKLTCIESEIQKMEHSVTEHEKELADPATYKQPETAERIRLTYQEAKDSLLKLYDEWALLEEASKQEEAYMD